MERGREAKRAAGVVVRPSGPRFRLRERGGGGRTRMERCPLTPRREAVAHRRSAGSGRLGRTPRGRLNHGLWMLRRDSAEACPMLLLWYRPSPEETRSTDSHTTGLTAGGASGSYADAYAGAQPPPLASGPWCQLSRTVSADPRRRAARGRSCGVADGVVFSLGLWRRAWPPRPARSGPWMPRAGQARTPRRARHVRVAARAGRPAGRPARRPARKAPVPRAAAAQGSAQRAGRGPRCGLACLLAAAAAVRPAARAAPPGNRRAPVQAEAREMGARGRL